MGEITHFPNNWNDVQISLGELSSFQEKIQKKFQVLKQEERLGEGGKAIFEQINFDIGLRCLALKEVLDAGMFKNDAFETLRFNSSKFKFAYELDAATLSPEKTSILSFKDPYSGWDSFIRIPGIHNQCIEHLLCFFLEPVVESFSDPHSYLFRKNKEVSGFKTDLEKHLNEVQLKEGSVFNFCMVGEIEPESERLYKNWVRAHIPLPQDMIDGLFESGIITASELFPKNEWTIKLGRSISHLIDHLVLTGLEELNPNTHVYRFGPKILIFGSSQEEIHYSVRVMKDFLIQRGLNLYFRPEDIQPGIYSDIQIGELNFRITPQAKILFFPPRSAREGLVTSVYDILERDPLGDKRGQINVLIHIWRAFYRFDIKCIGYLGLFLEILIMVYEFKRSGEDSINDYFDKYFKTDLLESKQVADPYMDYRDFFCLNRPELNKRSPIIPNEKGIIKEMDSKHHCYLCHRKITAGQEVRLSENRRHLMHDVCYRGMYETVERINCGSRFYVYDYVYELGKLFFGNAGLEEEPNLNESYRYFNFYLFFIDQREDLICLSFQEIKQMTGTDIKYEYENRDSKISVWKRLKIAWELAGFEKDRISNEKEEILFKRVRLSEDSSSIEIPAFITENKNYRIRRLFEDFVNHIWNEHSLG